VDGGAGARVVGMVGLSDETASVFDGLGLVSFLAVC